MRLNKEKAINIIFVIAGIIFLSAFLVFGYKFINTNNQYIKAEKIVSELIDLKTEKPSDVTIDEEDISCYDKYKDISELNSDMVGWIEIPGTNINHPVMQSTYEPEYYLYRDFYKNPNNSGTPFAQANCAVGLCGNTIIYGHNMSNGTVFSELANYTDKEYAKKHPIQFDTLTKYGKYQVIAAFSVDAASDEFPFWEYLCSSDEELLEYAELCKQYSYYDTNVVVEAGDKLISLVTCEYTHDQGRLVVVAKEIQSEGV